MAINRDSNVYTIVFATVMVIIVGGLLAFLSMSLKPIQKENVTNEKMQNILQAIGIEETDGVTRAEAGEMFKKYITRRITINYKGEIVSDKTAADEIDPQDKLDAFNINIRKEYSRFVKPIMNQYKGDDAKIEEALANSTDIHFPIFVCENNGETYYVLSASGKGLWDDIWGYVGVKSDATTINGSVFDHKGETPGLGSIIAETRFEEQFIGKTIEEAGAYSPIQVLKPGKELNQHQVDGISGATFTGVGVDEMLERNLKVYYNYFKNNTESGSAEAEEVIEEEVMELTEELENDSTVVADSTLVNEETI
jgi:Na+-transporting NADH:ubiquinone oxidoreductase subunit C